MAGSNGGRRIWLPPGTERVRAADVHDGMTVEDWLKKPETPATRGEVAAFGESLIRNQVRELVRIVVEGNNKLMLGHTLEMIQDGLAAHEAQLRAQRWYRRLGRWIATFGHRPALAAPETLTDFDAIDKIVREAEVPAPCTRCGTGEPEPGAAICAACRAGLVEPDAIAEIRRPPKAGI